MHATCCRAAAAAILLASVLVLSCRPPVPPAGPTADSPSPGLPWFEEVTGASGIDFHHYDSSTLLDTVPERMGSGLGWIDYDNDGWPDLFCVQDGPLRPGDAKGPPPTNKLYRNNGDGTFTDVTERVGLARSGFGMGCAVGDFDNDGYDDLLVTYLGSLVLYHNQADGRGGRRFVDVTVRAGLTDPHWATSCAWGDIDGDGFLDLYVCNYSEIDLDHYQPCETSDTRIRHHCPPSVFPHVTHRLYRNNRDGTFTDVSKESGIATAAPAPGLGVVMCDLDGDGRLDIYVANDMKPAYLFHNQGKGRFVEKALLSGCALGPHGRLMAGMGVEAGDVDRSGRPSLFVTDFYLMGSVLFRNRGNLLFQEVSAASGLGPASIYRLGFGTVLFDANLDGGVYLAVANGNVYRNEQEMNQPFAQKAQLFVGDGHARFRDISEQAGGYFQQRRVGRGLAWADYDNDGRPDLAFSNNAGPIALLHNGTATGNGWVRLELVGDGKRSNRNAIGARVEIESGGTRQVRFLNGGGSYLSASDRRLLVGLGTADHVDRVTVRWPAGHRQEFRNVQGRRWWRLHEGKDDPELVTLRPGNDRPATQPGGSPDAARGAR
jgi:hypothetical protein